VGRDEMMEAASVGAREREVMEARLTELETVLTTVFRGATMMVSV
jgi:hypothetical protein